MNKLFLSILLVFGVGVQLRTQAQPLPDRPRDGAYDEHVEDERRIIPYDYLREADVFWRKRIWRVIDCQEKVNLPFVYPKEPLITLLLNALKNKEITVYDPIDDEFTREMDISEIESILSRSDTIHTISPITYLDTMIISRTELDPLSFKKYRLKEDWIFDEELSMMYVRIIGFAPVREVIDQNTGEKRGESVLFWVHYPSVRQVLANKLAFNTKNSAIRMSWEDIFEMRMFGSYIVKEDNEYDREIQSYALGIDAVLESERVKLELFKFEHELWHY
jgi:gliding motility associated protien GldN